MDEELIRGQVLNRVTDIVWEIISYKVDYPIRNKTWGQVRNQVYRPVYDQVGGIVEEQICRSGAHNG